ncbi:MAG: hypothetical protein ACFFG0_02855 [Candidatus Thorarchaeota archaeon]
MKHQNKITIKEHELWDFTYKEICLVCGISKFDFIFTKEYKEFKRRIDYFLNKKRKKLKEVGE